MPSVDNIAPIIDACLRAGDDVIALFDMPYDHATCPRMRHLSKYQNFQLIRPVGLAASNRTLRRLSRFIWNAVVSKSLLRKHRIDACFVEWGDGIDTSVPSLFSVVRARRLVASIRDQLIRGSLELGISVFCLPHGANTKRTLAPSAKIKANMETAGPEGMFANRNCFTRYVVDTEYFRATMIEHFGLQGDVVEAWGAPRFSLPWLETMASFFPAAKLPIDPSVEGLPVVVFMMPKWHNDVDRPATTKLIKQLVESGKCRLVLKLHPRFGYSELDGDLDDKVMSSPRLQMVGRETESSALIEIADMVIDLGSSIALEVIARSKLLVYPNFLHTNRLVFDELGGAIVATSEEDVMNAVSDTKSHLSDSGLVTEIETVLAESIYAGKQPHNVADACRNRVAEIVMAKAA